VTKVPLRLRSGPWAKVTKETVEKLGTNGFNVVPAQAGTQSFYEL